MTVRYAGESSSDEEDSEGGTDGSREGKGGGATTKEIRKVDSAEIPWLILFFIA